MLVCALAAAVASPSGALADLLPSMTTSSPSASSITLGDTVGGDSVYDTATVTGSLPTGTVSFSICGPLSTAAGCATGGDNFDPSETLGGGGTAQSTAFTPTQAGHWCFRADYSGDTVNQASSDGGTDECFTVDQATSSTSSAPAPASIVLGTTDADNVTVTGNATGGSPTGNVDFSVCGPSATSCSTGGTSLGSVALTPAGDGQSSTAGWPSFAPSSVGTYCFRADYEGDGNYLASTDDTSDECFTVTQATPTASSTPQPGSIPLGATETDKATITGNSDGGSPTGNVDFSVCGPGATDCSSAGTPVGGSVSLTASADGPSSTATSSSFTPTALGTYCFRAEYQGDTNYAVASDGTSEECFTVGQATPTASSSPQSAQITLGGANTDNVTVTGNSTGGSPTGTVDFSVCGPSVSSCATGGTIVGSDALTKSGDGTTSTASSPSFTPKALGTYCFRADYQGATTYAIASDGTSGECFTVGHASSGTSSSPQSGSITLGAADTDEVTVTGNSTGGSPTGTVDFSVCGPLSGASGCATGGTSIGSDALVKSGDGTTSTASLQYTPTALGTWCFRADYQGAGNYQASSDGSSGECFTVTQAGTSTSSSPQNASIVIGASNTDNATVTGNSTGGSPTGMVKFSICGPPATSCTTGGTLIGSASLQAAGDGQSATASSAGFTPTAVGSYCFRADYQGAGNYTAGTDGSAGECFTVTQATPTVSSSPQSAQITLGGANSDNVTVTGNSTGGSPLGTVDFSVCGPLSSASGCATGGTTVGSDALTKSGDGTTSTASSPSFTPNAGGIYCFRADYQGATTYAIASDGTSGECFTVGHASSGTSSSPQSGSITLGAADTDEVTVTGNSTLGSPTGTVDFSVCGPLSGASGCATGGTTIGSAGLVKSGDGITSTASLQYTPTGLGTWCFRADYQGDTHYATSSDGLSGECFTVSQAGTLTSSSPQNASIVIGASNTDNVTVTGNSTGGTPTGMVKFSVCGPPATSCTTGGTLIGSASLQPSGDGQSATASSPAFTPTAAGSYCFRADYQGAGNYTAGTDGSSGECFMVTQATPTVNSHPQNPTTTEASTDADVATVMGNRSDGSPTGTVNFFICGPGASSCATGGSSAGSAALSPTGDGQSSKATSPLFTPTASGMYCFRAEYQGDTNYAPAKDAKGPVSCFTVPEPGAPTAAISSPAQSAYYAVGQAVPASYSCAEASGGPGISSCAGNVADGAKVDTSALGSHTFTVTATSSDGKSTPVTVGYTVAGAPSATITSPRNGATYTLGTLVGVGFGCSEGQFGPGLAACNAPSTVDTNSVGAHAFAVTAISSDGQQGTTTVNYNVARPSNRFKVSKLKAARKTGQVTFRLALPGGGRVAMLETVPRSALPKGKPKPGRLTFAGRTLNPKAKATLSVTLQPNKTGRALVKHHRSIVYARLAITFTPINGKPRTRQFRGLRVSP